MLLSTRPPPGPQMENQRLLRPHLHGETSVALPAAAMGPGWLEALGSEPSAGVPYFPLPPSTAPTISPPSLASTPFGM